MVWSNTNVEDEFFDTFFLSEESVNFDQERSESRKHLGQAQNDGIRMNFSNVDKSQSGSSTPQINRESIPPPPQPPRNMSPRSLAALLSEFTGSKPLSLIRGSSSRTSSTSSAHLDDLPPPPLEAIPPPPSPPVPMEPIPAPPTPPRMSRLILPNNRADHQDLLLKNMPTLLAAFPQLSTGSSIPPPPRPIDPIEARKKFQQNLPPPRLLSSKELGLEMRPSNLHIKPEPVEAEETSISAPQLAKLDMPSSSNAGDFQVAILSPLKTPLYSENPFGAALTENMEICMTPPVPSQQPNTSSSGQLVTATDGSFSPPSNKLANEENQVTTPSAAFHTNLKDPRKRAKVATLNFADLDGPSSIDVSTPTTEASTSESTATVDKTIEEYKADTEQLQHQIRELIHKKEWWKRECETARNNDIHSRSYYKHQLDMVEQAKTCLHAEIEDLKLKIEQANKKVEDKDKEMKVYVQDTIEKEAVIKAKEMEIDKLKTHLQEQNKMIVKKMSTISTLKTEVDTMKDAVKEVEKLKSQLAEQKKLYDKRENELRAQQESRVRPLLEALEKQLKEEFAQREVELQKGFDEKLKASVQVEPAKSCAEKEIQTDVVEEKVEKKKKKVVEQGLQTEINLESMAAIFDKNSDTKEIQTEIDNEVIADLLVSKEQSKKLQEKWEHAENMVNMVTGEHQKLSDVYESLRNTHLTTIEVLKNRKCLHCTSKSNKSSTNELAANFENLENSINLNKLQKQKVPRRTQSDSGEVPRLAADTSRPSSSVQDPKDANMMATKKRPLQENVPSSSLNATMNGMNEDRVINLKKPKPEPEDDDIMVVKEVRKNKDSRANKKVKVEDINGSKKTTATATFYVSPMQPISNPPTTTPPNFLPPATSMPNMHTTFAQIIPTITSITNTPHPSTSNFHQATNPQVFVVQPNGAYAQTPMNDAQARLMQHLYFQQAMQQGRPMHPQPVGTLLARKTPSGRRHPVPNVQVNNQQQDEYRDDVRACVDSYRDLSNLR